MSKGRLRHGQERGKVRWGCAAVAEGQLYGARGMDCRLNVRARTMYSLSVGIDMCFERDDKLGGLNLVFTNICVLITTTTI